MWTFLAQSLDEGTVRFPAQAAARYGSKYDDISPKLLPVHPVEAGLLLDWLSGTN
jgi:hypothetical protein